MLGDINEWHSSKDIYDKEALGADPVEHYEDTFFGMRLDPPRYMDWELFRNMCYKWHKRLTKVRVDAAHKHSNGN